MGRLVTFGRTRHSLRCHRCDEGVRASLPGPDLGTRRSMPSPRDRAGQCAWQSRPADPIPIPTPNVHEHVDAPSQTVARG